MDPTNEPQAWSVFRYETAHGPQRVRKLDLVSRIESGRGKTLQSCLTLPLGALRRHPE